MSSYLKEKKKSLIQSNKNKTYSRDSSSILNSRQLTNIGTFRAYIVSYLKNHEKIKQDMTFLIRQLNPSESGVPIEIYVFANDNNWANYENIQSYIFDHLVAATSYFDLRIFQNPTGHDLNKLVKN